MVCNNSSLFLFEQPSSSTASRVAMNIPVLLEGSLGVEHGQCSRYERRCGGHEGGAIKEGLGQ